MLGGPPGKEDAMRRIQRGAMVGMIGAVSLLASPSGGSGTASVDVNGNGLSCFLEEPEGSGLFTVIDDVARAPHA